jgi:hypothetical protein
MKLIFVSLIICTLVAALCFGIDFQIKQIKQEEVITSQMTEMQVHVRLAKMQVEHNLHLAEEWKKRHEIAKGKAILKIKTLGYMDQDLYKQTYQDNYYW